MLQLYTTIIIIISIAISCRSYKLLTNRGATTFSKLGVQFLGTKGKAEHLYSALHGTNHFKALRHGSHSLTCKGLHASLYLVSVHQMAPPLNVVADI